MKKTAQVSKYQPLLGLHKIQPWHFNRVFSALPIFAGVFPNLKYYSWGQGNLQNGISA
jgi:hypothetical protein